MCTRAVISSLMANVYAEKVKQDRLSLELVDGVTGLGLHSRTPPPSPPTPPPFPPCRVSTIRMCMTFVSQSLLA